MKLRRLNEQGLQKFGWFLDSLITDQPAQPPEELLTETNCSDLVSDTEVERVLFVNRLEAAAYLFEKLSLLDGVHVEKDKGLWAWLALFYFEQLCTKDKKGNYKPGERARWIPDLGNFLRYYRHLLAGPYLIYRAHRDDPKRALILLCGSLDKPGDIAEQFASRQELVTINPVVDAATKLYIDVEKKLPKRGAAGKGAGSARRLADVLAQFDLTWDLSIMKTDDILDMLPKEFDKFRIKKDKND